MSWRGRLQRAAMLLSFLAVPAGDLSCADRKGTFDANCGHFYFHLRTLRDADATGGGGAKGTEMILSMGLDSPIPLKEFVATEWIARGKLCLVHSDDCEEAASAKIRLEYVSRNQKHASGIFILDFRDGRHEEGKFKAKYHHKGPRAECE